MNDLTYLTDHYDEKIKRIKEINAPLNFVFITDMHNRLNMTGKGGNRPYELAANAIRSIQYILDRCPEISFVVSGGDIGDDYNSDSRKIREYHHEVMDALYSLSVPVHCVIGNHDDVVGNCVDHGWDQREYVIGPEEMHDLCMKYNPTKENYYYVDDDVHGFRYLFLNVSDHDYTMNADGKYPFHWVDEISDRQCKWIENEALKTDKKIIVFCHAPLHNAHIFGSEGMPDGIKPYDDMINGPRMAYALEHCPNVVLYIAGHVHADNMFYESSRILSVTTLCAMAQEWAPGIPKRPIGTVNETAFDVFSIKDNVLYVTRFGAGYDRQAQLFFDRQNGSFLPNS